MLEAEFFFEIFGVEFATKNLEDFWSRDPCLWSDFPRDLFSFGCLCGCFAERIEPGWRIKNLSEFIGWSYMSTGRLRSAE